MGCSKILGLAHIGLFVENIEKTKAFYSNILGFEVYHDCKIDTPEGVVYVAFARNGDCVLEIVQSAVRRKREDGFFDHIALKVKNIEEVKDDLEKKGIVFEDKEITFAPNVFPPKGSKWILFRGPDGEHIEINEVL